MEKLKINIFFNFQTSPLGGANQFLKTLKKELIRRRLYEKNPNKANYIIFNSHHRYKEVLRLKLINPKKFFIHRIDGPVCLIRGKDYKIDQKIYKLNNLIADGTILQSNWSKRKNFSLGLKRNKFESIIMNASDPDIFFPNRIQKHKISPNMKCKLIASSWSSNFNKGFKFYEFLDKNLDFSQYSMIFIGRSPILFKNIKNIQPVGPSRLAELLRQSDIYITGSTNDPCSNSLIEALTCGIPCVVLNDGGHPEILKKGGEVFNTFEEGIRKIHLVKDNYDDYKNNIDVPNIKQTSSRIIKFLEKINIFYLSNKYSCKKINIIDYFKFILEIFLFHLPSKKIWKIYFAYLMK